MNPSVGVTLDTGGLIAVYRGNREVLAALTVGRILARARTSDITDAQVVLSARRHGQAVVTSDAPDLRRLDRTVRLVEI
jgi:hypothetical protein